MHEVAAKPKRITWRDWMPEGSPEPQTLLTRDEFLARLNAQNVNVDESDLRYWEYSGILPRAIKKWHENANYVFYPRWMLQTVTLLRGLRDAGLPLRDIPHYLQQDTEDALRFTRLAEEQDQLNQKLNDQADQTIFEDVQRGGDELLIARGRKRARYAVMASLDAKIRDIVQRYETVTDSHVGEVTVLFKAPGGEELDRYDIAFRGKST
jgi:DNA-binding transcriptional MerR regulator